jgi:hypothetical protein
MHCITGDIGWGSNASFYGIGKMRPPELFNAHMTLLLGKFVIAQMPVSHRG